MQKQPNTKGFIPGGAKLDAVDPRKTTRKLVTVAVPRPTGGNQNYENLKPVDVIPKRRSATIIQAELDDKDMLDLVDEALSMAMLINGYAGSGGDFFPYMFRQSKRGPLIGKRTWGGLVGISGGYSLVDGGSLTAPTFAIYNAETNEIIAENTGVDPDMDIDNRPDLVAQGRDPQLEAAVKHLMDELAKQPAKKMRKDTPKVGKNGKINP
jgi:C-terminal processing protease CtpA/Prc